MDNRKGLLIATSILLTGGVGILITARVLQDSPTTRKPPPLPATISPQHERPSSASRPTLPVNHSEKPPAPLRALSGDEHEHATLAVTGDDKRARPTPQDSPPNVVAAEPAHLPGAQLLARTQRIINSAGPNAATKARELLRSTDPVTRYLGAMVLLEIEELGRNDMLQLAQDEVLSVPVNLTGWLIDCAKFELADELLDILIQSGLTTDQLRQELSSDSLLESGRRATLELLAKSLDEVQAGPLLSQIVNESDNSYATRMKALALLQDTMEFEEYRMHLAALQQASGSTDPVWSEGIARMVTRLAGPAELKDGPTAFGISDVDVMLSRPYTMYLSDLVQAIETTLRSDVSYIQPGTAAHLTQQVDALRQLPLKGPDRVSIRRLEMAIAPLASRENADDMPPTSFIPPPPVPSTTSDDRPPPY